MRKLSWGEKKGKNFVQTRTKKGREGLEDHRIDIYFQQTEAEGTHTAKKEEGTDDAKEKFKGERGEKCRRNGDQKKDRIDLSKLLGGQSRRRRRRTLNNIEKKVTNYREVGERWETGGKLLVRKENFWESGSGGDLGGTKKKKIS